MASSVSSMERVNGMRTWMVTALSWRSTIVAGIGRLPCSVCWLADKHREANGLHQHPVVLAEGWSELGLARIGGLAVPVAGVHVSKQRVLLRATEYLAEAEYGNVVVED